MLVRFILLLIILPSFFVRSQADPRVANELYRKGNYLMAINEYHKLLKLDRDNSTFNFRLGVSYLKTNIDRKKSVFYLERAHNNKKKHDSNLSYYLGVAYALNYDFDKAIEILDVYLSSHGKLKDLALKRKSDCIEAKVLIKNPAEVSFENMGAQINSAEPDYYPFISGDETILSYTSRRKYKGKIEYDGYYPSDVYISSYDGSAFSQCSTIKSFNTPYNEQSTGMSADGQSMFFYSDNNPKGELFIVNKENGYFKKKIKIPHIDLDQFLESAVCISPDGNTVIFSSSSTKGYEGKEDGLVETKPQGKLDLWIMRKLPFGDNAWALPQNISNVINTKGDEDFPSFGPDGKTIYFSSNGHKGMGGWDLYSTIWNPEDNTFTAPKNLGYPLNTPDDERSISFTNDNKHAYISASRKDGYGDLDIYRITYELIDVKPALFSLKLKTGDVNNPFIEAENLTILDANDEIIGEYAPNHSSKAYTILLAPGDYTLEIDAGEGYELYSAPFKVNEFMNKMGKIDKLIILKKTQ